MIDMQSQFICISGCYSFSEPIVVPTHQSICAKAEECKYLLGICLDQLASRKFVAVQYGVVTIVADKWRRLWL